MTVMMWITLTFPVNGQSAWVSAKGKVQGVWGGAVGSAHDVSHLQSRPEWVGDAPNLHKEDRGSSDSIVVLQLTDDQVTI